MVSSSGPSHSGEGSEVWADGFYTSRAYKGHISLPQ